MPSYITLEYARGQLKLWLDAQQAVSYGQAYTVSGRSLSRANLADILKMIRYWQDAVEALETGRKPGRVRVMRAVPHDS